MAQGVGAQQTSTFKLSGGISHSESLAPLPESERVGAVRSDIPSTPALVNPYRNNTTASGSSASGTAHSGASSVSPSTLPSTPAANTAATPTTATLTSPANPYSQSAGKEQPQLNTTMYSQAPHIDLTQANYKKRLREIAEQNALATGARRPAKLQIKVPPWLAGQWQRTETNELSRNELPGGKVLKAVGKQSAVVTDMFGAFKDRQGNVFMVVPLGTTGAVDRGFAVDYHRVKKYDMIPNGKNSVVIKVQASHQVVSKKDRRVVEAYQDEELTRYTLVKDGLVKNDSSVKVFDQMGQPKLITHAVSTERRVKRI